MTRYRIRGVIVLGYLFGILSCGENVSEAPDAAPIGPQCGDQSCTSGESAESCSVDCPSVCGDSLCTHTETAATCPADCDSICGDNFCTTGESASSCDNDCPTICGDGECTAAETALSCAADCGAVCGDDSCTHEEDCGSCESDCGECMPLRVDVRIIGAVVNLTKVDGNYWDIGGTPSQESLDAVEAALQFTTPLGQFSGVVTALGGAAIGALSKPDPFGTIELAWQGPFDPTLNQNLPFAGEHPQDTYTPDWGTPRPGWNNIPYTSGLQISVSLTDNDGITSAPDSIGTAIVNAADIQDAYFSSQVWPVRVDDQTFGQLLFVTISVTASELQPPCGNECTEGAYTACTCASVDACGWQGDGVCDSVCSENFSGDFFDDAVDCVM